MSLDVYLESPYTDEAYWANITHNLGAMASEAMLYYPLWRPEEIGITTARELVPFLRAGLMLMHSNKEKLEKLNPDNGWGDYEGLLRFTQNYLRACGEYPDAKIRCSR